MATAVNSLPAANTPSTPLPGIWAFSASPAAGNANTTLFADLLSQQVNLLSGQAGNGEAIEIAAITASTDEDAETLAELDADLTALLPFLEAAGLALNAPPPVQVVATEATTVPLSTDPGLSGATVGTPSTITVQDDAKATSEQIPVAAIIADQAASLPPGRPAPVAVQTPSLPPATAAAPNGDAKKMTGTTVTPASIIDDPRTNPEKTPEVPLPPESISSPPPEAISAALTTAQPETIPPPLATQPERIDMQAAATRQPNEFSSEPPPVHRLSQPVGSPQWGEALGDRIVWMANRMENNAELVLTPPQMGRIEVSVSVNGDQANALFVSANPSVREALEAALPRLREALAEAGIQLGQAQVGAENARQSTQQENGRESQGDTSPDGASRVHSIAEGVAGPEPLKTGVGLVDVFA